MSDMKYHLWCPWCGRGETLSDGRGKVTISVQCEKCHHPYLADLDSMKTERTKPQRRLGRRK